MKDTVLTLAYVIKHGVNFEDNLSYGGPYGQGIVSYGEGDQEELFSGLAYDLFPSGELECYLFVDKGVKEGVMVDFYSSGEVKSIHNMHKSASYGDQFEFFETGQLKRQEARIAGILMTYTEFNEQGAIVSEKRQPTKTDRLLAQKFG